MLVSAITSNDLQNLQKFSLHIYSLVVISDRNNHSVFLLQHHLTQFRCWLSVLFILPWESLLISQSLNHGVLLESSLAFFLILIYSTFPDGYIQNHTSKHNLTPCVCSVSHVWLFASPWTIANQAPLSMGFSRQEYWSGLPFPSPEDLPGPGIEPRSPALQANLFMVWATEKNLTLIPPKYVSPVWITLLKFRYSSKWIFYIS